MDPPRIGSLRFILPCGVPLRPFRDSTIGKLDLGSGACNLRCRVLLGLSVVVCRNWRIDPFGAVQATMIGWGIYRGERPLGLEWIGLAMAILGLVILVFPGLSSPSPIGAMLMAIAGIAWGVYSLRGRGQARPIEATAGNFVRSLPFVTLIALLAWARLDGTPKGIVLAVISGAITSGLGYVLWYTALRGLTATRAALLQLSVPVIAALGGVSLLGEALSAGLIISTLLVVGGLALAIASKSMRKKSA